MKLTFFFSIIFYGHCVGQITFQKSYGILGLNAGYSSICTDDGGYLIAGSRIDFNATVEEAYLIKTDSLGEIQWTKTLSTSLSNVGRSIIKTFDNGYLFGLERNLSPTRKDIVLLKLDSSGSVLWTKNYDNGFGNDLIGSVVQTSDSGFILIGSTDNVIPCCREDILVIKTDKNGDIIWKKTYHGIDGVELGTSIKQVADGGYILTGSKDDSGAGSYKVWLLKITSTGTKSWDKTFAYGKGNTVVQTSDGGYLVSGFTQIGNTSIIMIKTDSAGILQWEKIFMKSLTLDIALAMQQTLDGGFILTGWTGNLFSYDIFLLKTDFMGNKLWLKCYGGQFDDQTYSVNQTNIFNPHTQFLCFIEH